MGEGRITLHVGSPKAVALTYSGDTAPKIAAKGEQDIAEQIIAIAKEHDVPLYQNAELVNVLATLELGEEIPEILYLAIAEIIAFAYYIQGKFPSDWDQDKHTRTKDINP